MDSCYHSTGVFCRSAAYTPWMSKHQEVNLPSCFVPEKVSDGPTIVLRKLQLIGVPYSVSVPKTSNNFKIPGSVKYWCFTARPLTKSSVRSCYKVN